ncbi:MAG: ABC transporter ATP-binding protein [Lachnospiraceae bacterium]
MKKGNEKEIKKESPLKRLWKLAENHTSEITFAIVLATAGVVFGILPYISGGKLVNGILSKKIDQKFYCFWLGIALLGYAGKSVLYALALSVSHKATFSILAEIRKKMLDKLPKLSLGTLSETPSGVFKQKILDQVEAMERPLAHMLPEMTANLLGPLFILVYLLFIDWRMALLSLVSFPLGMIFMGAIFRSYGEQYAGAMTVGGAMNAALVEYVDGLEVIRNYNQTESSYKKLSDKIFANAQYYYDWMIKTQFCMSMSKAVTPTTLLAVLPVGFIFYSNGSLSLENYLLSIILSFSLQGLLTSVMQFGTVQIQVGTMVDTVDSILKAPEQIHKEKALSIPDYNIKLENVSFSYEEGLEILSNISLKIEEGSTNAFVGLSGGGKSTIAKLIAGFWDVEKGNISLGGFDYKEVPLERLYNQISFISQDNFLFDENIRDNIRMGKPDATDREVEDIAKKSGCHDFIMNLENGYETRVGKSGSSLSGGERQRVTIARAMLKDSPITIFDEATAYMDPENEYLVQQALNKLMENKTVIVIAHRLSTIKDSDHIFVIDKGQVESRGKHEDLLEKSRTYKNLWFAHLGKEEK